ncbi:hypothetical protein BX661DRAFT_183712 [Kickxella alabastrina]|uniref:uncharacterized protein n=1 Tax=Kickxella alabastrina TaxID=61397 RepID=UPI00221FB9A0|nr:uncharacterized protein BX661DRAFT_183712 [Kickxella alabastrina]KAI7826265.1 hypothetical protein BX661DRAFT_183712 [Kickxella alabastrina]
MQLKSVLLQALLVGSTVFSSANAADIDWDSQCALAGVAYNWSTFSYNMIIKQAYNKVTVLVNAAGFTSEPNIQLFNQVIAITGTAYMDSIFSTVFIAYAKIATCNPYISEVASTKTDTEAEGSTETESSTESESSTETEGSTETETDPVYKCSEVTITYTRPRVHTSFV